MSIVYDVLVLFGGLFGWGLLAYGFSAIIRRVYRPLKFSPRAFTVLMIIAVVPGTVGFIWLDSSPWLHHTVIDLALGPGAWNQGVRLVDYDGTLNNGNRISPFWATLLHPGSFVLAMSVIVLPLTYIYTAFGSFLAHGEAEADRMTAEGDTPFPGERTRTTATAYAEVILRWLRTAFQPRHEMRVVDGRSFRHVSQRFYRKTEVELRRFGFSLLGDVEDVTLRSMRPNPRMFIRTMVSRDRTVVAAFFHLAPRFWWRVYMLLFGFPSKIIDFSTYGSSGTSYCTSTADRKTEVPRPTTVCRENAPRGLALDVLLERHRANLRRWHSEGDLIEVQSVEQVIELQNRELRLIHAHLQEIGWATREFLQTHGVAAEMVEPTRREIQRLLQRERATAGKPVGAAAEGVDVAKREANG